jgi:hypothetical protein
MVVMSKKSFYGPFTRRAPTKAEAVKIAELLAICETTSQMSRMGAPIEVMAALYDSLVSLATEAAAIQEDLSPLEESSMPKVETYAIAKGPDAEAQIEALKKQPGAVVYDTRTQTATATPLPKKKKEEMN